MIQYGSSIVIGSVVAVTVIVMAASEHPSLIDMHNRERPPIKFQDRKGARASGLDALIAMLMVLGGIFALLAMLILKA